MLPIKVMAIQVAAGPLDTQTVTVGRKGSAVFNNRRAGFSTFGTAMGSVSDGTSNIYGGASVLRIDSEEVAPDDYSFYLTIGGNRANSGWSSMTVNGTILLRASANSYAFDGTNTTWEWDSIGDIWPLTGVMTPVVFN